MKRISLKSMLVLYTVVCLFCACGSDGANEQNEDERPVGVRITQATRGSLETHIQVTGTIAPVRETFVGPKVSGRIEKFFVDEGDFVEQGSPLVKLEQIRFSLALKEVRAAKEESLADLGNLERKLARYKSLHEKGVVEKEAFDDIATQVDLARSRLQINLSRLEQAEEDMKDSLLKAPFAGFVVERRMNTSELYAGVSGEYIFHIIDTSTVEVEVNIFETKKKYLTLGKQVAVSVDALPEKKFEGAITVINPYIDPVSRKFLVKVAIPNEDYTLESGMFTRVSIPEEKRENALLVPVRSVVERNGRKVVFTPASGKAQERPITIGLTTHEFLEVLEGLRDGDSVIVDGMYAVKDKTPVVVSAKQQDPQP